MPVTSSWRTSGPLTVTTTPGNGLPFASTTAPSIAPVGCAATVAGNDNAMTATPIRIELNKRVVVHSIGSSPVRYGVFTCLAQPPCGACHDWPSRIQARRPKHAGHAPLPPDAATDGIVESAASARVLLGVEGPRSAGLTWVDFAARACTAAVNPYCTRDTFAQYVRYVGEETSLIHDDCIVWAHSLNGATDCMFIQSSQYSPLQSPIYHA